MEEDQEPTVKFAPRPQSDHPPLLIVAKHDYKGCTHERTFIDRPARKLTCQACGVDLDPYEFLEKMSRYGMNLDSRVAAIKAQHEKEQAAQKRKDEDVLNAVPNTLSRLQPGWLIRIRTAGSSCRGLVLSVDPTKVVIYYGDDHKNDPRYQAEFLRAEVTSVRVLKKKG